MGIIVPRYKQREELSGLPGARVTVEAPQGMFESPLAGAVGVAAKAFAYEKQKADMTAFLEADVKAAQKQAQMETKYKQSHQMKDAAGAASAADEEYNSYASEVATSLSGDQKAMFEKSIAQRRSALYTNMEHHAAKETDKYRNVVTETYVAEARNDAISAAKMYRPGDVMGTAIADKNINMAIDRSIAAIQMAAVDNHMDDLWVKNSTNEMISGTHRAVIDVMLSQGNDLMAQDYFNLHAEEITGEKDSVHINKALEEGSVRGESQRLVDMNMVAHDSWSKRYDAVKDIKNPKVRAAANQLMDEAFAQEKRIEIDSNNKAFVSWAAEAEAVGSVRVIPPGVWSNFTPNERTTIEQRLKHMKEGTEPSNDYGLWTKFQFMAPSDIAKLTEADMMRDYRPGLDNTHYDRALAQVNATKDAVAKGDASFLTNMQTNNDIVKNTYSQFLKKEPGNWSDDDKLNYTKFDDEVAKRVQTEEATKLKRKATIEEKQEIAKKALIDVVYKHRTIMPDTKNVPAFAADKDDIGNYYVPVEKMRPEVKVGVLNMARMKGIIPHDATDAEAIDFLGKRLTYAAGAGVTGASDEMIFQILGNGPNMPRKGKRSDAGLIKGR